MLSGTEAHTTRYIYQVKLIRDPDPRQRHAHVYSPIHRETIPLRDDHLSRCRAHCLRVCVRVRVHVRLLCPASDLEELRR